MHIRHSRIQHPVGQGFFHSGTISDGSLEFRYVYDCGAMPKYRQSRSDAIKSYRAGLGNPASLDILFISHAHADHVNGLPQLLKGTAVDTIMLPLLKVEDRIIAFARSAAVAPASARDPFYRDFIADPAIALARFRPRRILFVRRASPGDGAPGRDGDEIGPYDESGDQIGERTRDKAGRLRWRLVGRGPAEDHRTVTHGAKRGSSTEVDTIPDSRAVAVDVSNQWGLWLLAPYVDPGVVRDRHRFFKALAGEPGFDKRSLADSKLLGEILSDTKKVNILAGAYKAVQRDLNLTSLCLYSGPARNPQALQANWHVYMAQGRWQWSANGFARFAWLATGDAALKDRGHVRNLTAHYRTHLGKVGTMTLPHHGSDNNLDDNLLGAVEPVHCVASADRYSTWRHPGSRVMQIVASRGIPMKLVTSSTVTELTEEIFA